MKNLNKLKQELLIMKTNNIKPNYSELARLHKCDRRTVKKYDNGYEGKPINRKKESKLDKHKDDIKSKLDLPGATIKGVYQYFKDIDINIGNYSNFYKYAIKYDLVPNIEMQNLTEEEKKENFKLMYIPKNEVINFLKNNKEINATLSDTIMAIKVYLNLQK